MYVYTVCLYLLLNGWANLSKTLHVALFQKHLYVFENIYYK